MISLTQSNFLDGAEDLREEICDLLSIRPLYLLLLFLFIIVVVLLFFVDLCLVKSVIACDRLELGIAGVRQQV